MTEPRIYVADLAAYNNSMLHGVWIDASLDVDDIQEQINRMLASSPVEDAEEYAIHDLRVMALIGCRSMKAFRRRMILLVL